MSKYKNKSNKVQYWAEIMMVLQRSTAVEISLLLKLTFTEEVMTNIPKQKRK